MDLHVNIIAHNEEKVIAATIESILRQDVGDRNNLHVHVFANGCTDQTEAVVTEIARADQRVRLHSVKQKGKVNAVKESIAYYAKALESEISTDRLIYTDADIQLLDPQALVKLSSALDESTSLYLVSAYPAPSSLYNKRGDFVSRLFRIRAHLHREFQVNMIRGALYVVRCHAIERVEFPDGLLSDDMYMECRLSGHFKMTYDIPMLTELKTTLQGEIRRDRFHLIAREQVYSLNRRGLIPPLDPETSAPEWRLTHQAPGVYLRYLLKRGRLVDLLLLGIWHMIYKRNEKKAREIFRQATETGTDLHTYWSTVR